MAGIVGKSLLVFFMIILMIQRVEACSCIPSHPQGSFCAADFGVKAKILSRPIIRTEEHKSDSYNFTYTSVYYKLKLLQVYKGRNTIIKSILGKKPDTYPQTGHVYIHTSADDNLCGADLKYNTVYVLTGRLNRNRLHITSCNWKSEWSKMSKRMREGVKGGYDCRCSVSTCYGSDFCYPHNSESTCKMRTSWTNYISKKTIRHCSCQQEDGECVWKSNSVFDCELGI